MELTRGSVVVGMLACGMVLLLSRGRLTYPSVACSDWVWSRDRYVFRRESTPGSRWASPPSRYHIAHLRNRRREHFGRLEPDLDPWHRFLVLATVYRITPFGRRVRSIGSNRNAALFSGVPVRRTATSGDRELNVDI